MVWLLAVVAVILFFVVRKARPAKAKKGRQINVPKNNQEQGDKSQLTIATYNVQTGKSLSGKRNINKAADVITKADIVGIQEVYGSSWLNKLGLGKGQTQCLADHSGFAWLFSATRTRWCREHRGNALLSRLPVTQWQSTMLPDYTSKSYRNMLVAKTSFNGQDLWIINTHLHTRQGRQEQLKVVLEEFAKYPRAVLMGDFNTTRDDDVLQAALSQESISDAIGLVCETGDDRIDWILSKGLTIVDGCSQDKGVSDHPFYQVTFS